MTFSRWGAAGRDRIRLPRVLILVVAALLALLAPLAGAAGAASGGAAPAPPPKPASKPPRPTSSVRGSSAQRHAPLPQPSPFIGKGMWIWYVSRSDGGSVSAIAATARSHGVSTLVIKAGDGANAWSQFNPQLLAALHAYGLKACAWQYVYGNQPTSEADVGAAAVRAGADCLLIDAESEYQGKYVQAQQYITTLRKLIGASFPVGLAGFPYIDYHPAFPYSVFLGRGGAQYDVPQMYWPDIGDSVDNVYAHTYEFNWLFQRPIEPLGELSGDPPASQIVRFRQLSKPYGASLVSWWDWQDASAAEWQAIAQPFANPGAFALPNTLPLLTVSSAGGIWAGDLVVWAQEHLLEAGEIVQIDGDFGAETQTAVEQFQAAHGLPVTGEVDQPTWDALLAYPRPTVVWTSQKGKATAAPAGAPAAARDAAGVPVPWSARLPPVGYEIPRDLGAGRSAR